ncbi:MAG: PIG-L family deacetylase [Candidatus Krumholzibacteria bacterium]|nr:PIG-L family deacetylase [Candidatus Krumholzibacteria bacterium]
MNVLVVGAHHDDIELGCGGTVARLTSEGHTVYGVVLTNSETHYDLKNIHRTKKQAIEEARKAAEVIGLKLVELDYPQADNGMLQYDVELMRCLERFIVKHGIKLVFSHWQYDMNTDHEAAAKITIVAARHVPSVLMYRSNWYQPDRAFSGIFYVDISRNIDEKIKSLESYSVEIANRSHEWIDSFIDHNRSFGFSIDTQYAEIFEPIRYTLINSMERKTPAK